MLLSYLNNPNDPHDYKNLAPEDVKEIIQRTTYFDDNIGFTPPYHEQYGWGRINMGAAINMVDTNGSRIVHVNNYDFVTGFQFTEDTPDVNLRLLEDDPHTGYPAGNYKAEVWHVKSTVDHDLQMTSNEVIKGFWARSSASASYPQLDSLNRLDPYEKAYVDEVGFPATDSTAIIWGYYYYLKDSATSNPIGWIPSNPHVNPNVKMSYTVYIADTTYTSLPEIQKNLQVQLFPNPTQNSIHLVLNSTSTEEFTITMFNSVGQLIRNLFTGKINALNERYDVGSLNVGLYIISVSSSTESKKIRFVIAK